MNELVMFCFVLVSARQIHHRISITNLALCKVDSTSLYSGTSYVHTYRPTTAYHIHYPKFLILCC